MKISKLLAALIVTALGSVAQATTYNYSYTFYTFTSVPPVVVTGSFDGTADGNLVKDLSHITAAIDGVAFNGSGSLFSGHAVPGGWQAGGAIASFGGLQNNFIFADAPAPKFTGLTNLLWASPLTRNPYPHVEVGSASRHATNYSGQASAIWTLTAAVPEPETYAMLLAGLGLMGAVARRRQNKQA